MQKIVIVLIIIIVAVSLVAVVSIQSGVLLNKHGNTTVTGNSAKKEI